MSRNTPATKRGFGYNPESQSMGVYVDGVMTENFSASTNVKYYVDAYAGSDSNDGRSWASAFQTYQAGSTAATALANKYKEVDVFIGAGEYDEQIVVDADAQDVQQGTSNWTGYKIGRLRFICMGKAVVIKNSTLDSSHTISIERMKTELHGGTYRNYTDSGDFAAVHWERKSGLGDVINGMMFGCKVEGRSSAQIGIDLDAAQYVWIEDCMISGFDTGILIAGNSYGGCVENTVKHCTFRGNTNDVLMGASSFTLLEDNIHYDPDTTLFVGDSDFSGRGGTIEDLVVYHGMVHAADLTKMNATNIYHFAIETQDATEW